MMNNVFASLELEADLKIKDTMTQIKQFKIAITQ